jgi:osmotically-inducible protein OsmY
VQAKYYQDGLVRGRNVSVFTEGTVVTLKGTVESEAAKQRAVALARNVPGVTGVNDQLRVEAKPGTRTAADPAAGDETAGTTGSPETVQPAWITTKIQAQYFMNREVKPWNVDVTTSPTGVVILEGEVESPEARAEAVRIARATDGVSRVEDRLRVKSDPAAAKAAGTSEPPRLQRPDGWLTAKVESKYFLDEEVKGRAIDVETQNGLVTLKGTVGSEQERRQAVALARNTEGVRDVSDQLRVDPAVLEHEDARDQPDAIPTVPELERPDVWVTMKIQSKFFLDPQIKSHDIDVDTTSGMVLLRGMVPDATLKDQAERIARDTEGVSRVVNQLTVGKQ